MSTRGIVAVLRADGEWSGFEISGDAYPDGAGAEVLKQLRTHGLDACCQRTVQARLFSNMRERARPETHANRGDLSWAYFLYPVERVLRVFHEGAVATPNAPHLFGTWGEVAVHAIHPDGSCTPPTMNVKLPAPWPLLRIDDSWDPTEGLVLDPDRAARESDAAATTRLEMRRRVARECAAVGLATERFYEHLEQLVIETLFRAPWQGDAPRCVYVCRQWTSGSKYWSTDIAGHRIVYAPPGWGRANAIDTDGTDREVVTLFTEPNREVEVDVRRSALRYPAEDREAMTAILRVALIGADWLFSLFDLVRAVRAPDTRGEALEQMRKSPREATDWRVYVHPDGRVWSIRPSTKGYQLRLGAPDDDPIFKDRVGTLADLEAVIAEQVADGFARRG